MMIPRRFLLLGTLFALAACGGDAEPPGDFPPLHYEYLTRLPLNVASIDIDQRWVARGDEGDASGLSPVPPVEALRQMATDRLRAVGNAGRAVFVIQDASIREFAGQYNGTLAVRLEIYTSGGTPAAYAEAAVRRARDVTDGGSPRQVLYALTKQMMDDMNVELEYQLTHALHDWLQMPSAAGAPGVVPAPVQTQDLTAPR